MPYFISALWALIGGLLRTFWGKLFVFIGFLIPWILEKGIKLLGISLITYVGVDLLFSQVENYVFSKFDGLPSDLFALLVIADLDWAIQTIFAWGTALYVLRPNQRLQVSK